MQFRVGTSPGGLPGGRGLRDVGDIDGASHVDLYDKEQHVGPAVSKLTDFFETHLAKTA